MTDQQESLAEQIVDSFKTNFLRGKHPTSELLADLDRAIKAALTAARQVPPGHVRGSDGVDREIVQEANGKIAGVQHRVVWVRIEAARSKSE